MNYFNLDEIDRQAALLEPLALKALRKQPISHEDEAYIVGKVADIRHIGPKGNHDMAAYYAKEHLMQMLVKAMERIDALEVRLRLLEGRQGHRVATAHEVKDTSFAGLLGDE